VKGLLALILFVGAAAPASPDTVDRIAATVNDAAIPESEVRKAMVTSALRPESGESPEAFRARVLDALIDQHLQYEDAQRFGPAPPDANEIAAAMRRLEDRLRAEGKDPESEFFRAGLTREEVRASIERQLLIQRYLRERFTPVALADEERAREEYEKYFLSERRAAGLPDVAFEAVADDMRKRAQERAFEEEVEKWRRELRQKARIGLYRIPVPLLPGRERVVLSSISKVTPTPGPVPPKPTP
jgi:parvulin-like peptidyl-prolyl isomerase